jgi:hypothetical protein
MNGAVSGFVQQVHNLLTGKFIFLGYRHWCEGLHNYCNPKRGQ